MTTPTASAYDLITEEVVRMSLRQVTTEMVTVMKRTSGNPVLTDGNDFSVQLFSSDGDIIESPPLTPYHTGTASMCLRHLLRTVPEDDIREGDMFLTNDPYISTGHANDFQLATPVFVEGRRVAWCFTQAHMIDIGGVNAGGWAVDATDCFGEALRIPVVKLIDAGVWNTAITEIITENVRMPALLRGDLRSMVSTNQVGARRLEAVVARYGIDAFLRHTRAICDRSEAMARERIRLLPDGIYQASDWQEHNGHVNDLFQVKIQLEVEGDELSISCVGEPQTDGLINASPPSVAGHCFSALLMVLFSDIPVNEGLLRPMTFLAVPGTTVCATKPAPLSSGHLDGAFKVGTLTVSTITKVLAQAADEATRDLALAPWAGSWGAYPFAGLDDAGNFTVFMDMMASGVGGGATRRLDGLDVSGHMSGVGLNTPDIESNEQSFPVLYLWNALAQDSGGPGKHRGGVGIDSAFILWGAGTLSGTTNAAGWQIPVPGAMGGYPAGTNKYERITGFEPREWFAQGRVPGRGDVGPGDVFEAKSGGVRLTTSDVWRVLMPGGGGYGDPLLRDPGAVVADVVLGAVSPATATAVYGVVLDGSPAGYDAARTEVVRADALRARRGDAAERPPAPSGRRVPLTDTVDLVRTSEGDVSVCRHCDRVVAAASVDWRDGARRSVRNLGDWAASAGMWIQRRDDTDLVELSCPSCGVLLETTINAPHRLSEVDFATERLRVLR